MRQTSCLPSVWRVGALSLLLVGYGPLARVAFAAPVEAAAQRDDDPDHLFETRREEQVRRAAALWDARLASHPSDGEAAWKLARARYWLGANGAGTREVRRPSLEAGIAAARRAVAIAPASPHGHFWLAANMGQLSELFGRREGLRHRDDIRRALEATIAADPTYLHGAAQRALGRWYATVPGMFGGNRTKGESYLRASLTVNPTSTIALVLFAELLLDTGRRDEARASLTAALAAPPDPDWTPEDERFKARARERLAALGHAKP